MKLGKNDRFVITLGVAIIIIALMYTNLIFPKKKEIDTAKAELEVLENQYDTTAFIAKAGFSTSDLENQKKQFHDYKNTFYDVQDSYAIDKILNELCQKDRLSLVSMQLSDTTPVTVQENATLSGGNAENPTESATDSGTQIPQALCKLTATVNVTGTYSDIMHYVDEMDALGKSVVITNVVLTNNDRSSEEDDASSASVTAEFYGIVASDYERPDSTEKTDGANENTNDFANTLDTEEPIGIITEVD